MADKDNIYLIGDGKYKKYKSAELTNFNESINIKTVDLYDGVYNHMGYKEGRSLIEGSLEFIASDIETYKGSPDIFDDANDMSINELIALINKKIDE